MCDVTETSGDELLVRVTGHLGRITLNRPRVLNALSFSMVHRLRETLEQWAHDPTIDAVLLDGAGDRGLCAGGDVREILTMTPAAAREFWAAEYRMNHAISKFSKPYVALMDGVTMGGGIGVSAHGSVRIVTERSRLAMPETRIGLAPDVGGNWILARSPGRLGEYLAVTGTTVGATDAIYAGLADIHVSHARLPALVEALGDSPDAAAEIAIAFESVEKSAAAPLASDRAWIDYAFSAQDIPEILARLDEHGTDRAAEVSRTIGELSPTAVRVALTAVRRARELPDLASVLEQDLHVSVGLFVRQDFREGVRAQMIDKDRNPRWQPASIGYVADDEIEAIFAG